jgi:hypothetical protein
MLTFIGRAKMPFARTSFGSIEDSKLAFKRRSLPSAVRQSDAGCRDGRMQKAGRSAWKTTLSNWLLNGREKYKFSFSMDARFFIAKMDAPPRPFSVLP